MGIEIGDVIGDYRVEGVLGHGGMGEVFRVRSLLTAREEAMKIVRPDKDETPDLAERFLREIRVHASLDHPNIAALRAAVRTGGRILMIMELVEGAGLDQHLRRGPLDAPAASAVACQVLNALEYAHAHGVIHRDIKPANILIAREGRVKLTDFGIARSQTDRRLTQTGSALGSLPYMSPEQIRSQAVDARSDIYSLGVALYETVTGQRPIQGDSNYEMMNAHFEQIPKSPVEVLPAVPRALSDAILKALAKSPADRFQSAAEFRTAIRLAVPADADLRATATLPLAAPAAPIAPEDRERMEKRLSRALGPIARRLVADAARDCRTAAEMCARLADQIPDAREREAFVKSCGAPTTAAHAPTTPSASESAARNWDPALLARLAQALTPHLGPIAVVVVNRAAKKAQSEAELLNILTAEVPEPERKRFLATKRG